MDWRPVRRRFPNQDQGHACDDSRRAQRRAGFGRLREGRVVQPRYAGELPGRAVERSAAARHVGERRGLRSSGRQTGADVRRQLQALRKRRLAGRARRRAGRRSQLTVSTATTARFEAVIGLEIHAHLLTASKIFCGCSTAFGAAPNTHVCPVCLGFPGSLPVLNGRAVDLAIRAALALGCTINETSIFARKNYFYPDLPKGYQISQYERPLASNGVLEFPAGDGIVRVGVTRVHLEEDAG